MKLTPIEDNCFFKNAFYIEIRSYDKTDYLLKRVLERLYQEIHIHYNVQSIIPIIVVATTDVYTKIADRTNDIDAISTAKMGMLPSIQIDLIKKESENKLKLLL